MFSHQLRPTVSDLLHGTVNQIDKSIFYAVVLAFQLNRNFYLTTEDTVFGDFDDLVIVTAEREVKAIQFKHQRDAALTSPITVNKTLFEPKGDYTFYEYYRAIETRNPNWINEPLLVFEFETNRPLEEQFAVLFNSETKKFKPEFFNATQGNFALMREIVITSILMGNHQLSTISPTVAEPYLNYLDCLLASLEANINQVAQPAQIKLKKDTLKNLYAAFEFPEQYDQQKINFIRTALAAMRTGLPLTASCWNKLSSF